MKRTFCLGICILLLSSCMTSNFKSVDKIDNVDFKYKDVDERQFKKY